VGLVTATLNEDCVESDILCKNEFFMLCTVACRPFSVHILWKVCCVQPAALFAFLVHVSAWLSCGPVACLTSCVNSSRVLEPWHILHHNTLLCLSTCEVITYGGWCRIESHLLQCNMFIVYRTTEVHFTCTRPYWGYVLVWLLLESDCHVLFRLRSVRGRTIKFANSPPCSCRGSTGQKP
jgi:hypothetical protein